MNKPYNSIYEFIETCDGIINVLDCIASRLEEVKDNKDIADIAEKVRSAQDYLIVYALCDGDI